MKIAVHIHILNVIAIDLLLRGSMGRKTACDATQWHELTRTLARRLARKMRAQAGGKISIDEWRRVFGQALREAAQLAVEDCNVQRIVDQVLSKFG